MAEQKKPAIPVTIPQSKVFGFPPEILSGIRENVAAGARGATVLNYMKRAYRGPLALPNRKTIDTYIKWLIQNDLGKTEKVSKHAAEMKYTMEKIKELQNSLDIVGTDPTQVREGLQKLVRFLFIRMEMMSQLQDIMMDPKIEMNMIKQAGEIRVLYAQILEMENQRSSYESVASLSVKKFFTELVPVIRKAVEDTHGTQKTKEFLDRLNKGYRTIDFDRILSESRDEIMAIEKEGSHGSKETRIITT